MPRAIDKHSPEVAHRGRIGHVVDDHRLIARRSVEARAPHRTAQVVHLIRTIPAVGTHVFDLEAARAAEDVSERHVLVLRVPILHGGDARKVGKVVGRGEMLHDCRGEQLQLADGKWKGRDGACLPAAVARPGFTVVVRRLPPRKTTLFKARRDVAGGGRPPMVRIRQAEA